MCVRIERVVDGDAGPRAEAGVGTDDRISAAVGKDKVVARDQAPEGVVPVVRNPLQGRRGIDVPEDDLVPFPLQMQHLAFQQFVEDPDAARLDDQVRPHGGFQGAVDTGLGGGINHHARPVGVVHVAVRLPLIGVRLVERYPVPKAVQGPHHAAVVGSCSVPVGGNKT